MSYPRRFDLNQFDSSSVSGANNAAHMTNNGYPVPLDPYQAQSFGGIPAPIAYSNSNPSIHPPNMFLPPIDFSVPPPNFPQMNVSKWHTNTSRLSSIMTTKHLFSIVRWCRCNIHQCQRYLRMDYNSRNSRHRTIITICNHKAKNVVETIDEKITKRHPNGKDHHLHCHHLVIEIVQMHICQPKSDYMKENRPIVSIHLTKTPEEIEQ